MKKAIITGASSGLGYEIASKFIEKRVKVVNLSRRECNLDVENIKTDLTKNEDIENAIELIKKEHKDADILVLCAGTLHWHNVGEAPIKDIDNDLDVNITSIIKMTEGLMPLIEKNKGDIVIIGSTSSFVSYGGDSIYVAAKHAVLGYIRSLQKEFKKKDVRIFGVHPGGFKSQLHEKAGSGIETRKLMDPKDIAGFILCSLELPRNMEISEMIINRKNPE